MSAPLPNNKRDAHFAPSDDLERLAQTIIDVLRGVLNIEPRVVDELRSIAASQPVARNAGTPRIPRGRKTVRPCGTCSQVKLKCVELTEFPNLCKRCLDLGLPECPPHKKWTKRRVKKDETSTHGGSCSSGAAELNF